MLGGIELMKTSLLFISTPTKTEVDWIKLINESKIKSKRIPKEMIPRGCDVKRPS